VHGGEGRAGPACHLKVVVSHDGQVPGNGQAQLAGGIEHAEGLQVTAREDGGGPFLEGQQLQGMGASAVHVEVAVPDQGAIDGNTGCIQG
jgi:hypothetical protein